MSEPQFLMSKRSSFKGCTQGYTVLCNGIALELGDVIEEGDELRVIVPEDAQGGMWEMQLGNVDII